MKLTAIHHLDQVNKQTFDSVIKSYSINPTRQIMVFKIDASTLIILQRAKASEKEVQENHFPLIPQLPIRIKIKG